MSNPKKPTADEKVLSAVSWGAKKQICGEKILDWYAGLQAADGGKAAPTPAPQPEPRKQPPLPEKKPKVLPKISP